MDVRASIQVQGLMEVFGREWCHAYVWTVNGSALWTFTRDRRYWAGVYEVRISKPHASRPPLLLSTRILISQSSDGSASDRWVFLADQWRVQ